MKNEFLYGLFIVVAYFILSFVSFTFLGNSLSQNLVIFLNIILAAGFTFLYFSQSTEPSGLGFAIILVALFTFAHLLLIGVVAKRGLEFFYSIYFWLAVIEYITIPLIYQKYAVSRPIAK